MIRWGAGKHRRNEKMKKVESKGGSSQTKGRTKTKESGLSKRLFEKSSRPEAKKKCRLRSEAA